jgi:hypothetical protein
MPFTRHPLDYPINRLLLRVGMWLQIWAAFIPPARDRELRRRLERGLAEFLELDQAVEVGLLKRYQFCWNPLTGRFRTIKLIPHPRYRRSPGIYRLHQIFFLKK